MKEILLYTSIWSYTAEQYITRLEENKGEDIRVRMNCPGGDVYAAYGMIAKFNEHPKGKVIQVDGWAASCGFFLCCAADEVESLNVSDFLVHRAALPSWYESDPQLFTAEVRAQLEKVNKTLRAMIEAKCTAEDFAKVTGTSLDDVFSLDTRIDVVLTAQQAKKLGIVSKITPITKSKKEQVQALAATYGIAAFSKEPVIEEPETPPQAITTQTRNTMALTLAELKAQHPEAYKAAIAEERDRAGALLAFIDIDQENVIKAINEGTELTQKMTSEFTMKAINKSRLTALKQDSPKDVETEEVTDETAKPDAKAVAAFEADVRKQMGLK